MSYELRGAALMALAALALAAAGCSNGPANKGASGGTGSSAAVVTVNGEPITQAEFFTALQSHRPRPTDPNDSTGKIVLTGLINAKLTEELAKKDGVAPTQQQIDTAFNNRKMLSEAQSTVPFETALSDSLLTADEYKQLEIQPIVAQLNLYTKGTTVSDDEAKAFYNSHKDQFTSPQRAHVKRIVVGTQAQATSIYNQIKAGKQFEEFIGSSLDHSTPTGDVYQWIPLSKPPAQLKPIVDAVNATAEGEVAPPVKIGAQGAASYWILKVVEKKPAETKTFDQVKDIIHESLLSQKANQNFLSSMSVGKDMADFQKSANLVAVDSRYQPVIDAVKAQAAAAQTASVPAAGAPPAGHPAPAPAPGPKPGR